jgi:Protein of unknown function (DUF3750)
MQKKYFDKLLKPDGYQIFLLICPASIPCNFAAHPWFVCVKNGEISRWEVRFEKNDLSPESAKHLQINSLPPFSGIEKLFFLQKKLLWHAKLLGYIEGGDDSLAKKIYDFIIDSSQNYPWRDIYGLFGPNSNTFAQWVLDHFPEFKVSLPWNCVGKGFKG